VLPRVGWAGANRVFDMQPGNGNQTTGRDLGQTFTVPTNGDRTLDSYQLLLGANTLGTAQFQFLIYPFDSDTAKLVGSPLYSSGVQSTSASPLPVPVIFAPHLTLTPGGIYAAIVQQKNLSDGGIDLQWRINISLFPGFVDYPGGDCIFTDESPPWTNTVWFARTQADVPGFKSDLTFTATFTPEPATLPLVLTCGLIGRRARRAAT
jgi:hypothetical protein